MKHLTLSVCALCLLTWSACKENTSSKVKPDNYVVLIDLSDRILTNVDQRKIDSTAIQTVFNAFEQSVTQHLVLTSEDRFLVRLFKQDQTQYNAHEFEDVLSLDMGQIPVQDKANHIDDFKAKLADRIYRMYETARLGSETKDYPGVDIWQYFKQQINSDLVDSANNSVIVLTDGHFDFESKARSLADTNGYTVTNPILKKLSSGNWETTLEQESGLGILPVKITKKACWIVCGISSKPGSTDLQEANKLGAVWKKWLNQSGASCVSEPIIYCNADKTRSQLQGFMKSTSVSNSN